MNDPRSEILGSLHDSFRGIHQSSGKVCLLRGAPGAGKTHLARRFLQQLPEGAAALVGAALPTGTPPLLPICAALASDPLARLRDEVSSTVTEYAQTIPLLKETLGPFLKTRQKLRYASISPDIAPKETHTFFVLSEILRQFGRHSPTVLFLDDVQWLDASSVSFLGFLAEELAGVPVLLLLATRANGADAPAVSTLRTVLNRTDPGGFLRIELPPLTPAETVSVAEHTLKGHFACSVHEAQWLTTTTRGNPQYVKEVVALLRDTGRLANKGGVWYLGAPPDGLILPPSLRATTLARFSSAIAQEPQAEALVLVGALCGPRFDMRLAAQATGLTVHRAMRTAAAVSETTGLVRRIGATTEWEFDHELTREAILSELGEGTEELHKTIAGLRALDPHAPPLVVANHYRHARCWQDAAEHYWRAATKALEQLAFEEATLAARAHRDMLSNSHGDDGALLIATELVGRCLVGAAHYGEAIAELAPFYTRALTIGRLRLVHALARAKLNLPDASSHSDAVTILRAATRHQGNVDAATSALLWTELMFAYDAVGKPDASQAAFRRAYAAAIASRNNLLLVRLLRLTCIFWQPERVIEATERALRLCRKHRYPLEEAFCLNNLGTEHWYSGDVSAAAGYFDRARCMLESWGGYRDDVPTNNLGLVALVQGRVDEAKGFLSKALSSSRSPGDRLLIRSNLAVADALSGNIVEARASLGDAVREADAAGDPFHRDCIRANFGRALLLDGKPTDAIREVVKYPPRRWLTDDALVIAKRAGFLLEATAAAGGVPSPEWNRQHSMLDLTTKRQCWLYRLPWELCDIQFWQD